MKSKRRPRQATTTPAKRRPAPRKQKRVQKLIAPSPRIERDFYVPNNPHYFSTISHLHNYVGDNGDLFPHLNCVGTFDREHWSELSENLEPPTTSPSDLADIVSAFDCIEPVDDDERAVECVSGVVQEQLSLPRAMNSFNGYVSKDDISDKVILRQLLLGDAKTYSTDDFSERKKLFESSSETNDGANIAKFGNLFRDSVGVVVDQADFLQGIYNQDEKLCCSVEPAQHYVPAPDLTFPHLSKLPNPNKPVAESLTISYDPIDSTKDFIVENLLNDSTIVDDEAVDYYCCLEEFEEILDTIWKDLPEPQNMNENDPEIACEIRTLESPQPSVSSLSAPTFPLQTEIDTTPSIIPRFGDNEVDSTSGRSAGSLKLHNGGGDAESSSVAEAVSSSLTGAASAVHSLSRTKSSTENLSKLLGDENSIDSLHTGSNIFYEDENMIYKTITHTTAPDDDLVAGATSPSLPSSNNNETLCSSPATLAAIASITASPLDGKNAILSRKRSTSGNFTCDSPVAKLRRTASTCGEQATDLNAFSPTAQQRYDDCALGNAVRNSSDTHRGDGTTSTVSALPTVLEASTLAAFYETPNCSQNQPCQVVMDSIGSSPLASTSDIKSPETVTSSETTHKMFWKKKIKYSRSLSITGESDFPSPFLEPTTTAANFDDEKGEKIDDQEDAVEPMEDAVAASILSDAPPEESKHLEISDGRSVVKKIKNKNKKLVRSKKCRKSISRIDAGRRTRSQSKQQPQEQQRVEQPEADQRKEITENEHTDPNRATTSPVKDSNIVPKVSLNLLIQKNIVDFTPVLDLNSVHENLYRRHVNFLQLKDLTVAKCKVMRKTLHRDRFRLQQIINLMEKLSKLLYYYYVWECRELKRERQCDTSTAYSREWEESKRKEIVENMETTLPMTGNQRFDSKIFEHFHSFLQTLNDESSRSTQTFHAKERLLYDSMNLPHVYSGRSILLPVKQYVRSYVHDALSYDTCKYLLENDGEKNNSKSIGVSANANAQTVASLSVCLVEKQIPSVEEISERGGSVPRVRCVQSWKREYEKFYYTLNFLFIINYKFVLYSHHCNFLISYLTKQTEERHDTTGFSVLPQSFWRKCDDANFPYIFTPILKGHTLSDKLDMCVPSPGNPQTPASVRPVDISHAEMDDEDHDDVLTTNSESAESASEENEVSSCAKPTIINVLTLQQKESPPISDTKNDSSSPPLSLKILCEQPALTCNESSLDILEIDRQRSVALNRHLCFEKKTATKNEPDIEQVLQRQLNMVKILNRDSIEANDLKNLCSTSDSRRANNQYTLLERVSLRAFFSEMSVAEKQQTLISIKEEQFLFFYLEQMYLKHHCTKDKRHRLSDCALLDQ